MAYGKIEGDWQLDMEKSRVLAMIEPVTEGIMQLFIQIVILYIVNGPGEGEYGLVDATLNTTLGPCTGATTIEKPLDLTQLLYNDDWSKLVYMFLLLTSAISVGTSFVKVRSSPFHSLQIRLIQNMIIFR